MSDIRIARAHRLPLSRAKAAAQAAADEMARLYQVTSEWQGDSLHFRRGSLTGRIDVSPSQVAMEIRLGFLLRAFRRSIEEKVGERLDAVLAEGRG